MRQHLKMYNISSNYKEYSQVSNLFIVDWTEENKKKKPQGDGACCSYEKPLEDVNTVEIKIEPKADVVFTGFQKRPWKKQGVLQCDALIFPASDEIGDATLFLEIKNSLNLYNIPKNCDKACRQITDTINELKERSFPLDKRELFALISFPMLKNGVKLETFLSRDKRRTLYDELKVVFVVSNMILYNGKAFVNK